MLPLVELQKEFLNIVKINKYSSLMACIKESAIPVDKRLEIYHNTISENLRNALELTYPIIWKLIGNECANSVAYQFSKHYLPGTGCLDDWGSQFSDFLETFSTTRNLPYLRDVAKLEWTKHLAYCAPDAEPISLSQLQEYATKDTSQALFVFHPSSYLFDSTYQLNKILELVNNSDVKIVNIHERENIHCLIIRPYEEVVFHWLSLGVYIFLKTLKEGNTIEASTLKSQAIDANFNLQQALSFTFQNGVFINIIFS